VKKRKINWFCRVSRTAGLAKIILQGTTQRGKSRGRQKDGWEIDWAWLRFCDTLEESENNVNWAKTVAGRVCGAPMANMTTG